MKERTRMNIAIVDDMPRETKRITGIINEYADEHHISLAIKTFRSGEAFLEDYNPHQTNVDNPQRVDTSEELALFRSDLQE